MNDKLDDLLKHVLIPQEKPSDILNHKILSKAKEETQMKHGKQKKVAAALLATALIGATSVTAYAAYHFMNPGDVADRMGDEQLAGNMAQLSDAEYESQTYGGYQVTFLGMVSGKGLSQHKVESNGEIRDDRTYFVVAIQREDGVPVDYEKEDFFVSPLIGSQNPSFYNAGSLLGGYGQYVEDGVLYRLLECENIEYFADQNLYLCVTDTTFYQSTQYHWDEQGASIARNEDYDGLNALFELHLDASKADPQKAQELIDDVNAAGEEEGSEMELTAEEAEVRAWADNLTPENIEEFCVRMENTVQTKTPDQDGNIAFDWLVNEKVSDTAGGGMEGNVEYLLENKQGLHIIGLASLESMEGVWVETLTLNPDGTVTFAVYVPKDVSMYLEK